MIETANITITIGDHDVDVYVEGNYPYIDDWRIYRGSRRMRGLEKWIWRDRKRLDEFLDEVYWVLSQ